MVKLWNGDDDSENHNHDDGVNDGERIKRGFTFPGVGVSDPILHRDLWSSIQKLMFEICLNVCKLILNMSLARFRRL